MTRFVGYNLLQRLKIGVVGGTCIGLLLHTPQSLTSILLLQNCRSFAPCYFELGSLCSPSLYAKSSEPDECFALGFCVLLTTKKGQAEACPLFVVKVPKQEPFDKKILAILGGNCNIYCKLVLFLKLDTQVYYNMRLILGLEYK